VAERSDLRNRRHAGDNASMPRFLFRLVLPLSLAACSVVYAQQPPSALSADPAQDAKYPASMVSLADLPSHG
jgi:hypothetical protein